MMLFLTPRRLVKDEAAIDALIRANHASEETITDMLDFSGVEVDAFLMGSS